MLDQVERSLAVCLGHVHALERFDSRLVRSDLEYVPVELELFNRITEIAPETPVTLQQDAALRMQIDLVRVRCNEISLLRHEISAGYYRLSGYLEVIDGAGDTLQLWQPRPTQRAELDVDRADAIIVARVFERIDYVLQYGLRLSIIEQLGDRTIERIPLQFLDDYSNRLDKQCRPIRKH